MEATRNAIVDRGSVARLVTSGVFLLLVLALASAGCQTNKTSTAKRGVKSDFESAEDPPLSAQTHYAAGQLAESQNNFPSAVRQYEASLVVDSTHEKSLYRLGVLYSQAKEYNKAIEMWRKYAKVTKDSPTAMSNLGFCCELAGRNDDAEAAYRKGIAKDPNNVPCRINYGLMLARHGHTNEATLQLQTVLSPAEVHYNLASVYQAQGRKEQARQEYKKALELNPNFEEARQRMALIE
jgi:tetratricopeptide (TPR) repeat protein